MKKILILMFIFVLSCQTVQAKAKRVNGSWWYDSRPMWSKTVKVNPDREGAMFIHDYTDEDPNIYDSFDCVLRILLEGRRFRGGMIDIPEEYSKYIENEFAYEYGDIYYRVSKYDEKIAQIANDLDEYEDFEYYLSRAKRQLKDKTLWASFNLKDISEDKIIVLPQTIDNHEWVIGDVLINQNSFVFEYIPKGSDPIGNAKEVFSIEFVKKDFYISRLVSEDGKPLKDKEVAENWDKVFYSAWIKENFAKDLDEYKYKFEMYNKLYQQDLGFKYEEKELSRSDEGFTWYWGFGDNNENVVMAVKEVEDGYFRVAYLKYNSMSEEEVDKCKSIVEERIKTLK